MSDESDERERGEHYQADCIESGAYSARGRDETERYKPARDRREEHGGPSG
jgi:hypothetical protein